MHGTGKEPGITYQYLYQSGQTVHKGSTDVSAKMSHTLHCLAGATRFLRRLYRADIKAGKADINAEQG